MAAASRRVSSPEIIGREAELASMQRAIDEITEGRPRVVILGGEGGVGKTRLMDAIESNAGEVRFLRGNCLAFGAAIPFLPFAEILRELLRQLDPADIAEVVGPASVELARFMPEIETVLGMQAGAQRGAGDLERLRLYEALLRVAERIARDAPTVFVIEDVQWIDEASLELLSFLTHSIRLGRMLLVISVRTDAVDSKPEVVEFLADLERRVDVDRVELEALGLEATRRQIEGILGASHPPEAVQRIWELGDGNPLFTEELLASSERSEATDIASPRLHDLVGARLGRLPRSALAPLRVAAIGGDTFDVELLARTSGRDVADVETAIGAAVDEQLLVLAREDGGYRFRHEIVRSTVASQLGRNEAQRVHAAYADALEEGGVDRRNASKLAFHRDAAGEAGKALEAHVEAGRAAREAFAYAQALEHFERALSLWPQVEGASEVAGVSHSAIMHLAAAAAAREGEYGRAIELSRQLLADGTGTEAEDRELVRSSLRWYLWEAGRHEEALEEAMAAVARTDDVPATWRANALAHLAGLLLVENRFSEARGYAEEAIEIGRDIGALDEQALSQGVLGWCLFMEGDVDAGLERIREAIAGARRLEARSVEGHGSSLDGRYPVGVVLGYEQLTAAMQLAGRFDGAVQAANEGVAVAAAQGIERTYGSTLRAAAARSLYRLGRWDEAIAEVDRAVGRGAYGPGRAALLAARALVEVGRGRFPEAASTIEQAEAGAIDGATPDTARWIAAARAESFLWQGQPLEAAFALASVTGDADGADGHGRPGQAVSLDPSLPSLLVLGARTGAELATAERAGGGGAMPSTLLLDRVRAGIRRAGRRPGLAASWAAELAIAKGELQRSESGAVATAVRRWSAAVEAALELPYQEAYARYRLAGAFLGDRKRRQEGAEQLVRAADIAKQLGANALGDAVAELQTRAGLESDGATDRAGTIKAKDRPYGLTAREVEVLGLLAAGWGNNDIADHLFISPKTASVHVSNIYGKLGVESRVAAATLAHDLGLAAVIERDEDDDR